MAAQHLMPPVNHQGICQCLTLIFASINFRFYLFFSSDVLFSLRYCHSHQAEKVSNNTGEISSLLKSNNFSKHKEEITVVHAILKEVIAVPFFSATRKAVLILLTE